MRTLLFVFFTLNVIVCVAQDDEIPDNRNKKESWSKMQEKDIRKDLASFVLAGMDERMNSTPVKAIPPVDYGNDYIKFQGDDVQVIIKAGTFDPSKHKLAYNTTFDNKKYLVKIDGKPYWGSFGSVPRTTINAVTVIIDKDTVAVPSTAFEDLYSPEFGYKDGSGVAKSHDGVYFASNKHMNAIYIYMLNKETKGSYEVTWVIQDKKYLRRVVDSNLLK
jgi:hypothetical protein